MKIGIDQIGLYIPPLYIATRDLAIARNVEPDKYTIGIGQDQMALCPPSQDAVSMAANAAQNILSIDDRARIDLIVLATESGLDFSKSGATTIHQLLGIQKHVRCIEIKQACYGATAGIMLAVEHIQANPDKKALILASDISRYGLKTAGEITQGAGAIALLISADPRLAAINSDSVFQSQDCYDFYRPGHEEFPIVDGKYSNEQYIENFTQLFATYNELHATTAADFDALCFHIPYTKLGFKALSAITTKEASPSLFEHYDQSIIYNRKVGNIYTGSLYLSLLSLLENGTLKSGDKVGMYSYGSGLVAEFFTLEIQEDYHHCLNVGHHQAIFENRKNVPIKDYEAIFAINPLPQDSTINPADYHDSSFFYLSEIHNYRRTYRKNEDILSENNV